MGVEGRGGVPPHSPQTCAGLPRSAGGNGGGRLFIRHVSLNQMMFTNKL